MGKGSCGRVACAMPSRKVLAHTGASEFVGDPQAYDSRPRYNCGPGHLLPVLLRRKHANLKTDASPPDEHVEQGDSVVKQEKTADDEHDTMVVEAMRWGLVPSYTKAEDALEAMKAGFKMINARSDNLLRVHKRLLDRKRCVVVVDGFFEWLAPMKSSPAYLSPNGKEQRSSLKRPFFMKRSDGKPLYLAGLYDTWHGADAAEMEKGAAHLRTHTVITTESNRQLSWLHDRMPLILEPSQVSQWLDTAGCSFDSGPIQKLIQPYSGLLDVCEVSALVSDMKNNKADCLLPIAEYKQRNMASGIGAYFSSPRKHSNAPENQSVGKTCSGGGKSEAVTLEGSSAGTDIKVEVAESRAAPVIVVDDEEDGTVGEKRETPGGGGGGGGIAKRQHTPASGGALQADEARGGGDGGGGAVKQSGKGVTGRAKKVPGQRDLSCFFYKL